MFFIIIYSVISPIFAQEVKTKADFIPPETIEKPLTNFIPNNFDPRIGLGISSTAALTGITLFILNTYKVSNSAFTSPGSLALQQGLVLTGTYYIGTAISLIFIDFFLQKVILKE